ncbi:hypothetical protein B0T25DRAFT_557794 [Lasiosphaeria hispida]|uniref:Uncharacterized protein n=1 Tax=Lasiosphaeria hispida TaxID=260671 RepID=A0AAJ0M844_9PEZI|nr:hypothetical protein B0T25DRAFT_557794 [Lasiosphaeria hispida]
MATVPEFTGFHLCSTWVYTINGIKRFFVYLQGLGCDDAEFVYDYDLASIKVTCRPRDEPEIRQAFNHVATNIEREEFERSRDHVMGVDGAFDLPFAGDLISRRICDPAPVEECETDYQPYTTPLSISTYPYKATWKQLEHEKAGLKIASIIHQNSVKTLQQCLDVEISCDLLGMGKVVYIGGWTPESVQEAQRRLQVLLEIKKLPASGGHLHVLYVDNYVERSKSKKEIQADLRYMANIDPKLPITTLLDPTVLKSIRGSYKRLHEEGVSIRLKLYDPMSRLHISTFGPKILDRADSKQHLEHRPSMSLRQTQHTFPAAGQNPVNLNRHLLGSVPNTGTQVSEWMKGIPNRGSIAGPGSDLGSHGTYDTGQSLQSGSYSDLQRRNGHSASLSRSLASQSQKSAIEPNAPVPTGSPSFDLLGSGGNRKKTPDCLSSAEPAIPPGKAQLHPSHMNGDGMSKTKFKYRQPPLPPPPPPPPAKPKIPQKTEPHIQAPGSCASGSSEGSVDSDDDNEGDPDKNENRSGITAEINNLGHSAEFLNELDTALSERVESGPYKRKFAVRAEFGRLILAHVHEKNLSFNSPARASNVWGKTNLLESLNKGGEEKFSSTHFTKILSTRESDMNNMIGFTRERTRLWKTVPDETSIVYSFYCASIKHNTMLFVVDIVDGKGDNGFSSSVRPYTYRPDETYDADGVTPVYVHGLRRNWDLRIMVSYMEPTYEAKYEVYAAALLGSLVILKSGNSPELRFNNDTSSGVTVKTVRIGTRWRYLSSNSKSALEIKEVEQLTVHVKDDKNVLQEMVARRWKKRKPDSEEAWGLTQRWFEASVTSTKAESLFRQNMGLGFGQKADWTPQELREGGIFYSIYGPALAMLEYMDQVGANEDNRQGWAVKKPNLGAPGA